MMKRLTFVFGVALVCWPGLVSGQTDSQSDHVRLLGRYCVTCHNERINTAGLDLETIDLARLDEHPEVWEKVLRKLRSGMMPPPNRPQPPSGGRDSLVSWLEVSLDAESDSNPRPGRTDTLRRLNRTEYRNSIRDLLAIDIDAGAFLPPDESGHGFDNVTVSDLSPVLLDRYISAAQKISRLAIGTTQTAIQSEVIRISGDVTQEGHMPGLPLGTRGGVVVPFTFSKDGDYDIQIRLARNRVGEVGGLREEEEHLLDVLLDREHVETFSVEKPPAEESHGVGVQFGSPLLVDEHLRIRIPVTAGPHDLAVAFQKHSSSLLVSERKPLASRFNETRHPRSTPAVYEISISGPHDSRGASDTPSRRRIFVCRPIDSLPESEELCARDIFSTVMRRAYRRAVTEFDMERVMAFYRVGRSEGDFDGGIGKGLSAILMSPGFIFRIEVDPEHVGKGASYRVSDVELASRLSFFLWSSAPDDELLDVAIRGELSQPGELERQTRRMLEDPRSHNLASNFGGQWLLLRNISSVNPNVRLYPDFDDNLRQAFREETERFFDSVLREDRSVLELLKADYTFLNERLAKHYGIPGVYGSRFRRVMLPEDSQRGGLLRQGSILSVTSYATRTSPVIRGTWVLDNILGAAPPPPPPNVPVLEENSVNASLPMRERLKEHRSNVVCASCHSTIDPVGFALENFDVLGRWREHHADSGPIDASGGLPGIGKVDGVAGLEAGLLSRPELFAGSVVEKLLTFALGRGVNYFDAPAVRKILRDTEANNYRFSSLIVGIVKSVPFQMRTSK